MENQRDPPSKQRREEVVMKRLCIVLSFVPLYLQLYV